MPRNKKEEGEGRPVRYGVDKTICGHGDVLENDFDAAVARIVPRQWCENQIYHIWGASRFPRPKRQFGGLCWCNKQKKYEASKNQPEREGGLDSCRANTA